VVARLDEMAREVFGSNPVVISMPYQKTITPADNQAGFITFLFVGNGESPEVSAIRSKFASSGFFWLNEHPGAQTMLNGFGAAPPGEGAWRKIGIAQVEPGNGKLLLPTDDWPFLYLKKAEIPFRPSVVGIIVIAALSIVILLAFAPVRRALPNGQMFFLGAGFMLLETKGVVHMALLFGSTWITNSVVFFAILVMILLANLVVAIFKPLRLWPYYVLLAIALLVNVFVPMSTFLSFPGLSKTILSCSVIFVPIFFAGVIFAASFRVSRRPDVDFGSNIAGVILGGLSEYASLMLGFNYLLLIAIGYYALAAIFKPRLPAIVAAPAVTVGAALPG
jgi:hypothetical protein